MNTNELFKNREIRLGFASFIGSVFMSFVVGWVFLIPIAAVAFLLYGYVVYTRDQKEKNHKVTKIFFIISSNTTLPIGKVTSSCKVIHKNV